MLPLQLYIKCLITYGLNGLRVTTINVTVTLIVIILLLKMFACYRFQCYVQCKVCYHFNCIRTVVYGCVITYALNCQRVTAFSVTCSVKCVITSTVYGCVITYELNCLRVTASSVIYSVSVLSLQLYMGVLSLISSTVCMLPLSCYMQCKVS